jgi:hypothetical protein
LHWASGSPFSALALVAEKELVEVLAWAAQAVRKALRSNWRRINGAFMVVSVAGGCWRAKDKTESGGTVGGNLEC